LPRVKRLEWTWAVGISLGTALLVVAPFFVLGIASGHDFEFHAASWLDAAGQWKEGVTFPRWTEWANHGFGEPRFIFYPPLSWMLGAGLGSVLPWRAVPVTFIVLVQTLAGCCAFALGRSVTTRGGALFGAACYAANPYALLVIYMRSDFAEQLATAFFPLVMLLALRVAGIPGTQGAEDLASGFHPAKLGRSSAAALQMRRDTVWFAVVFSAIWLSNAPAGVMASYSIALLFAWVSLRKKSLRPGLRGVLGLALGFGLTAFYILPAAYEQRWVNIEQALASGLQPTQNFLFTAIDDPEHTLFNWIASGTAILLMVVTGLAALLAGRPEAGGTRDNETLRGAGPARVPVTPKAKGDVAFAEVWRTVLLLAAAATLLMLRFTNIFWRVLPKLRFVQFPWRWMCVLAMCYALFLACAFGKSRRGWILVLTVGLCCTDCATFLVHQAWWDTEDLPTIRAAILHGTGFEGTDEYDPRGDDHSDLPAAAPQVSVLAAADDDGAAPQATVRIEKWTAIEKRLRISSPHAARIALRLLDYPAWQVRRNGHKITPEHAEDLAQMVVPIGPGDSTIEAQFTETWDRRVGGGISLASLALLGLVLTRTNLANRRSA
jgi:hypothetical protein